MQCISLITSARIGIRSISPYSAWDINSCILCLVTSCSCDGSSWFYAETCNPAYTSFWVQHLYLMTAMAIVLATIRARPVSERFV